MVDEVVVVYVDRVMQPSARCHEPRPPPDSTEKEGDHEDGDLRTNNGRVKECRICQDDDDQSDMDAPCACNGTLKFAHRKCIQRWCNKKGNMTCEICYQVFSPNYTCPPPQQSNADVVTMDIRQALGPEIDFQDHHMLDFASAERQLLLMEYYSVANTATVTCLRSIAIILMLLLLAHQTITITRDLGMLQESSIFFHYPIPILQLASFLLPCYLVARSWYIEQSRRRRQVF